MPDTFLSRSRRFREQETAGEAGGQEKFSGAGKLEGRLIQNFGFWILDEM